MPRYKVVNNERIQFTAEEEAQMDADIESADLKIDRIRSERDSRLRHTDWTQIADAALGDHTVDEWTTYRQELRDLPSLYSRVSDVVWPEDPPTAKISRKKVAGTAAYDSSIDDGDTVEEAQAAYDAAYAATD